MAINYLINFNFSSIINPVPGISVNPNPCPDQLVGTLKNGVFAPSARTNIDYLNSNTISNNLTNPIVIILESPHKDEYNTNTLQALGPAMGKTGIAFNQYFDSLIVASKNIALSPQHNHDILFVNAIQYQCSLGKKLNGKDSYENKKQRDQNWLTCFNNSESNDLEKRIAAIKPYAIINLCTIGLSNLQLYVDRAVKSYVNQVGNSSIYYTIGNHPSTWIYRNGVIQ